MIEIAKTTQQVQSEEKPWASYLVSYLTTNNVYPS